MTRVLQAMAGAEFGGAERFFERLVPALGRAGVEQRVLIRTNRRRAEILRAGGIEDIHEMAFGGRLDLVSGPTFRRHIREFRPDVVLTWMSRASRLQPSRSGTGGLPVRVARLGGYYDLKYYRNCDWLIGDTASVVDHVVANGWPAERAIHLANFVEGTPGKAIARRDLYIPERHPLLLALGRLHPNKGFDVLVRAMALLPDMYLLLAGEGPERAALDDLATRLGVKPRIRFLGWRDDVADLFATADMFVHPARHEPLGNVVIEAWAHGVAVVAAAADGPRALIEDGVTGRLVPIDDAEALAAAVRANIEDAGRTRRMADAGMAVYSARYTEATVVANFVRFFEDVVARCAASPA